MAMFISRRPDETVALGERWGREAQPGRVIGLLGDLGAGKTQLVKGIARGLEVIARVHSPTFALFHEYNDGRLPLFHLDLYRLETRAEMVAAGLEEYFCRPNGVTVVEWAERWFGPVSCCEFQASASRLRRVRLEVLSDTQRRITYEDSGS